MLRYFNIIIILLFSLNSSAQNNIIQNAKNYISEDWSELLFISIENQILYHIKNENIINEFIISSSKYGTGNQDGSNKTPTGLHKIREKHGKNTPINGIMVNRLFYGNIAKIHTDKKERIVDDITSRVIWLEGMEKGKNMGKGIDSFFRYIYIHGTAEEGRLGTPASHGCIRMRNKEVIDLFNLVEVGTLVLIL